MREKTARRFLNRNKWRIAQCRITKSGAPSFLKRVRKAKKVLGDIRFREYFPI